MAAIETTDLQKRYGALEVLKGLDLRVEHGEVFGLLGPNGAGKSTLLHLLLGFLRPDGGQLTVLGTTPSAARVRLGYLPERVNYHTFCTAREYLHDLGALSNLRGQALADRTRAMLQLVGLSAVADRRIGTFSKGMLQRLGVAQALIHNPELLMIDEPTSGLDPAGQRELIDLLAELRRRKHTILLCSHQLAEVEALCDRVGILRDGRLAAQVRVADLTTAGMITIVTGAETLPAEIVAQMRGLGPTVAIAGHDVSVGGDRALQQHVLCILLDAGVAVAEVRQSSGGLMDLYLRVTKGRAHQAADAALTLE